MRTIQISEETYAAVWRNWKAGDQGEEDIIRRKFDLGATAAPVGAAPKEGLGYRDEKTGTEFPTGFEVFRTFKGKDYSAIAKDNGWMRDNNRWMPTLNALSNSIGAHNENAWRGWTYKDGNKVKKLGEYRDPSKVRARG